MFRHLLNADDALKKDAERGKRLIKGREEVKGIGSEVYTHTEQAKLRTAALAKVGGYEHGSRYPVLIGADGCRELHVMCDSDTKFL